MKDIKTTMKNKKSFIMRLKTFSKRSDSDSYSLEEYLDDCYRYRYRLLGQDFTPEGFSTSLTWLKHDPTSYALITNHLDEFEAWLKLQQ